MTGRGDPPYRRIVAELRGRILDGELRPGDRLPSVRQIARHWGVAVATATRVLATLRDDGLVEPRVGAGTVVTARTARRRPAALPARQPAVRRALGRRHLLRTAMAVADAGGLDAVSMRRLAAELGVGPMSLYRHVAHKDELVTELVDAAFGEVELPADGPPGWRAKLDLIARRHWQLCRRHPWLPRAVSFTRPLLTPTLTAHTEWTLRALDGLGLPVATMVREALTLHGLVVTVALSVADEIEAEQETGVSLDGWWLARRGHAEELLASGRFPLLATVPADAATDLDALFEYGLARHLDGFAALVAAEGHAG
ncbi:GntR family transcriptional regulator [Actinocatenispora rupis]|uniref:GntR family transcriptional regulator n=1 Tax=Actinocatenispora rupis TaxID=519421 RepID=A0A8J3IWC7_9ACTN|nr:GntR family transcriptional regulator [Actinocatenispora rupis]GID09863.1 GntR family transcriptional regulator [Actinocatenispora rupis]